MCPGQDTPMKTSTKIVIGVIIVSLIGFGIYGLIVYANHKEFVEEGVITEKRIDTAFVHTIYVVEINNNTEYEVNVNNYRIAEVGETVQIWYSPFNRKYLIVKI